MAESGGAGIPLKKCDFWQQPSEAFLALKTR
jgi:hypothetical protein